jgi:hypothetical protein
MSSRRAALNTKLAHKKKVDSNAALKLGASLPGVKANSDARGIALKLKGQLVACTAIHRSAEPNTLMVCIDFAVRDALLETQPRIYYMTAHYRSYATVLVRLAEIDPPELRNLLQQAVQFVGAPQTQQTAKKAAKEPAKKGAKKTSKSAAQSKSRRS